MIRFTPEAGQQVRELRRHYEDRDRTEAIRGLIAALATGWRKIKADPAVGLAAPRPYPRLAMPGRLWIKVGHYWIAYSPSPTVIVGVFYETADIPGRI